MSELWCVHVEGPDDVIAMPSKQDAENEAELMNAAWQRRRNPHPHDPMLNASAKPWPYSAEQHAEALTK